MYSRGTRLAADISNSASGVSRGSGSAVWARCSPEVLLAPESKRRRSCYSSVSPMKRSHAQPLLSFCQNVFILLIRCGKRSGSNHLSRKIHVLHSAGVSLRFRKKHSRNGRLTKWRERSELKGNQPVASFRISYFCPPGRRGWVPCSPEE